MIYNISMENPTKHQSLKSIGASIPQEKLKATNIYSLTPTEIFFQGDEQYPVLKIVKPNNKLT